MARSVQMAQAGQLRTAKRDAFLAAGFGVLFLVLKLVEWVSLIHRGHTFTGSEFFQYFFFLTAIQALHLLIVLVVLRYVSCGEGRPNVAAST